MKLPRRTAPLSFHCSRAASTSDLRQAENYSEQRARSPVRNVPSSRLRAGAVRLRGRGLRFRHSQSGQSNCAHGKHLSETLCAFRCDPVPCDRRPRLRQHALCEANGSKKDCQLVMESRTVAVRRSPCCSARASSTGIAISVCSDVVEFVCVAHVWPRFSAYFGDGCGSSLPISDRTASGKHAPHLHGAGAAFFEGRVIEICIRIGIQDFVRKLRRHGRIDRDARGCSRRRTRSRTRFKPFDVHSLGQGILHHFLRPADDWAAGLSPSRFSGQAAASGNTEASKSSARMRWICGGTFLPP